MSGGRIITIGVLIVVIVVLSFAFSRASATPPQPVANTAAVVPTSQTPSSPEVAIVTNTMVGKWRSIDDPKFTREFRADGIVVDRYEGDEHATSSGTWSAFTSANPDPLLGMTLTEGVVYIEILDDEVPMFFSVVTAAGNTLELIYIDRGSVQHYSRII